MMIRQRLATQARTFTTTSCKNDIFDFLKLRKPKTEQPQSTSEVMRKSEDEQLANSSPTKNTETKVQRKKLRIIGEPVDNNKWKDVNNGFVMNAWPVKQVAPKLTEQRIENALLDAYKTVFGGSGDQSDFKNTPLNDLQLRFEYTKQVAKFMKCSIPDAVISRLGTINDIHNYYTYKVKGVHVNEKEPDALYLNKNEFPSNVSIVDTVEDKRRQKKIWKNTLSKAKQAKENVAEEAIRKAMD